MLSWLAQDRQVYVDASHFKKSWPQLGLASDTVHADIVRMQLSEPDAAETQQAEIENADIEKSLGLEATNDEGQFEATNDEEQPANMDARGRLSRKGVMQDIRRLQASTRLLIPKTNLARVVADSLRSIAPQEDADFRNTTPRVYKFSSGGLEVLHTALEGYLVDHLASLNML